MPTPWVERDQNHEVTICLIVFPAFQLTEVFTTYPYTSVTPVVLTFEYGNVFRHDLQNGSGEIFTHIWRIISRTELYLIFRKEIWCPLKSCVARRKFLKNYVTK